MLSLAGMLALLACGGTPPPSGAVAANPTEIAFGDVYVGTATSRTVTLTNTTGSAVTIADVSATGSGLSASGQALPVTLAPGQSTKLQLTFAPDANGSYNGSVDVTSAGQSSALTVAYSAKAVLPSSPIVATPATVDFGDLAVGNASSTKVTLTNRSSKAVSISGVTSSSTDVTAQGLVLPMTLSAGASTTFDLVFDPAAAAVVTGNVTLGADRTHPLAMIVFSGNAIAPAPPASLSASPTRVDFGDVAVGSFSTATVTFTNGSPDPVTISGVTTSGSGLTASGIVAPAVVAPGASTALTVRFTPSATGAASGSVSLLSANQAELLATVATAGNGVATSSITSVSVRDATVETGKSVQLVADVASVGTIDRSVSWTVETGSLGSVDPVSGVYTAPATAGVYRVWATSSADPSKKGVGTVTVTAPAPVVAVTVTPPSAALPTAGTTTFAATVAGTTNAAVSWSIQEGAGGGSVTAAGVYTAPATAGTYHVVARSQADTTKSATATVTVTAPTVAVSVSPITTSLTTGGTRTFAATVTGTTSTGVTWSVQEGAAGGSITSAGVYTAPATEGTYHVVARSQADTTKSATATVTVTAAAPAPTPGGSLAGTSWTGSSSLTDYPKTGPVTTCYGAETGCIVDIDASGADGHGSTPAARLSYALTLLSTKTRVLIRNNSNATVALTSRITRNASTSSWAATKEVFAYGTQRIKLDGSGLGNVGVLRFDGATHEHWKGFEVVGNTYGQYGFNVLMLNSTWIAVEDFWIHDNPGIANRFGIQGGSDNLIQDSAVWNNAVGTGTQTGDGAALGTSTERAAVVRVFVSHAGDDCYDLFTAFDSKVVDSVALGCGRNEDGSSSGGDGNGFKLGSGAGPGYNNTAIGSISLWNRDNGFDYNAALAGPTTIIHCTAFENGLAPSAGSQRNGILSQYSGSTTTDNVTWGNGSPDSANGTVLRNSWQLGEADPLFADPANGDFSLRSTSPYAQAGQNGTASGASAVALQILKDNWTRR